MNVHEQAIERLNAPAISLYQRFGFRTTRVSSSSEGIPLIHLTNSHDGTI